MRKLLEINDPSSCLNKAEDNEPLFVLRAHDITTPDVVRFWLENAEAKGAQIEPAKKEHALACIAQMEAWPNRKLPD